MSEENRTTMRRMADKQVDIDLVGKLEKLTKRGIDLYESAFTPKTLDKIRELGWHNPSYVKGNVSLGQDYSWFMTLQYVYSTKQFKARSPRKLPVDFFQEAYKIYNEARLLSQTIENISKLASDFQFSDIHIAVINNA